MKFYLVGLTLFLIRFGDITVAVLTDEKPLKTNNLCTESALKLKDFV